MTNNGYEVMFILDANAYARNPVGAAEGIDKMIKDVDGEVLASRLWNEQKLAYPIKGRYKGAYWLTYCRINGARIAEFNRACQLNDLVLRHLIVRIDERLIDPLVLAAKGHGTRAGETDSATDAGKDDKSNGAATDEKQPATASADA